MAYKQQKLKSCRFRGWMSQIRGPAWLGSGPALFRAVDCGLLTVPSCGRRATCQGHPAGERNPQGQNPSLSESCCPTPRCFPRGRAHAILLQSWVSCLSACAHSAGAGPKSDSHLPSPAPNTHAQKAHRPHAKRCGIAVVSRGGLGHLSPEA